MASISSSCCCWQHVTTWYSQTSSTASPIIANFVQDYNIFLCSLATIILITVSSRKKMKWKKHRERASEVCQAMIRKTVTSQYTGLTWDSTDLTVQSGFGPYCLFGCGFLRKMRKLLLRQFTELDKKNHVHENLDKSIIQTGRVFSVVSHNWTTTTKTTACIHYIQTAHLSTSFCETNTQKSLRNNLLVRTIRCDRRCSCSNP